MDSFHAIQRVTSTIKKGDFGKADKKQFLRDLKLMLRQDDDIGKTRTKATPSEKIIQSKINKILQDWSSDLKFETKKALIRLRTKHAKCLCDMPPHCGTHGNERLHRDLNALLRARGDIGVEVAVTLLTLFFTMRNRAINEDPSPLVPGSVGGLDKIQIIQQNLWGYGTSDVSNRPQVIAPLEVKIIDMPEAALMQDISALTNVYKSLTINSLKRQKIEVIFCSPFHGFQQKNKVVQPIPGSETILDEFQRITYGNSHNSMKSAVIAHHLCLGELEGCKMNSFKAVAKAAKAVIIVLSNDSTSNVQTIVPCGIEKDEALILFHDGKNWFNTKDAKFATVQEPVVTDNAKIQEAISGLENKATSEEKPKTKKCSCGSTRKSDSKSCSQKRCPCIKLQESCLGCDCYNCFNPKKIPVEEATVKNAPCGCGNGSGRQGSKCVSRVCPCIRKGWKCSDNPK